MVVAVVVGFVIVLLLLLVAVVVDVAGLVVRGVALGQLPLAGHMLKTSSPKSQPFLSVLSCFSSLDISPSLFLTLFTARFHCGFRFLVLSLSPRHSKY